MANKNEEIKSPIIPKVTTPAYSLYDKWKKVFITDKPNILNKLKQLNPSRYV